MDRKTNVIESVILKFNDNECYEKIPVEIIIGKKKTLVFLESNGTLVQNSAKISDCDSYEYSVYLPNNGR